MACILAARGGTCCLSLHHFVPAIGLPAPGCSARCRIVGAFSAGIATRNCHRVWASLQKKDNHPGCSRQGSTFNVRLQSAIRCIPPRKGRRQTGVDEIQQLDHGWFCRGRSITTHSSFPTGRLYCSPASVRVSKRRCCNCQLLRAPRRKQKSRSALPSSPDRVRREGAWSEKSKCSRSRNANLIKTIALATSASAGTRKTRSTKL